MMTNQEAELGTRTNAAERADAGPMSNVLVVEPLVDIYENRDEVLLVADLPGVPKDKLSVRLDRAELTIEGAQPEAPELPAFRPVFFTRTFRVPSTVEASGVTAELAAGVLRVHLAKSESAKPRRITVRSA